MPGTSVDAERGFSKQNLIKTKLRNRFKDDHLDACMRISLEGPAEVDTDFGKYLDLFKKVSKRHLYTRESLRIRIPKSPSRFQYGILLRITEGRHWAAAYGDRIWERRKSCQSSDYGGFTREAKIHPLRWSKLEVQKGWYCWHCASEWTGNIFRCYVFGKATKHGRV